MILGRLIMRMLLVPLGGGLAIVAAVLFVVAAQWNRFAAAVEVDPSGEAFIGLAFVGAFMLAMLASSMLLPAIAGALVAEAFAIRSWMFHTANGGLSAWVGYTMLADTRSHSQFYNDPLIVVAAGIAAGFVYWLVAGWSAGFWKPVFERPAEANAPPPEIPRA